MESNLKVIELQELMNNYYQQSDFKKLLFVVNQLLIKDPNNSEYLTYKLKALEHLGKATESIQFLQHYVNMCSTDVTGFLLLYKACLEREDIAGAIFSLIYALSIDANDEVCLSLLFDLLQKADSKYKRVKINILTTKRIGHLAMEIEPHTRQLQTQEDDCLYLFLSANNKTANQYLYGLLKDMAFVIEDQFWFNFYATRPMLLDNFFFAEFPYDLNSITRGVESKDVSEKGYRNLISIYRDNLSNTVIPTNDIQLGWELLNDYGITKNDKLVCLHVRDSAYLSGMFPSVDFSYHDYRDAKIESYRAAIEYLLEQGYKVIRIGNTTNQSLALDHGHYFDFCINPHKEHAEFLEVFLISQCDFLIGTMSGPIGISAMFDTPSLLVNVVPFNHPYLKYSRFIPKQLFHKNTKVNFMNVCNGLSLDNNPEVSILNVSQQQELTDNHYAYLDNRSDDIFRAVVEFSSLVKDRQFDVTYTPAQQTYVSNLPDQYIFKTCPSIVCDSFLQQYPEIFNQNKL